MTIDHHPFQKQRFIHQNVTTWITFWRWLGVYGWDVNSTVTKHSDYCVWKDTSERVTPFWDNTSWQEASAFLCIKTPPFWRDFSNKKHRQKPPEMLSPTRYWFYVFKNLNHEKARENHGENRILSRVKYATKRECDLWTKWTRPAPTRMIEWCLCNTAAGTASLASVDLDGFLERTASGDWFRRAGRGAGGKKQNVRCSHKTQDKFAIAFMAKNFCSVA